MSCEDARARLSDLADGRLDATERAAVEAHVGACAECRQEWVAFRRTLSLLHALPRHQAPAGFAERVLAAVRPKPWHRRLFLPPALKLPLEAAALIVVALGVVWLVERAPEVRQVAEAPPPPTPSPARRPEDEPGPSSLLDRPPGDLARETRLEDPPSAPRSPSGPGPSPAWPTRSARPDRLPPAALIGHLTVDDRDAAERALVDLMTRVGVTEVGRAQAPAETVVEIQLPQARYPEFARGLAGIGRWRPESEPGADDLEMRLRVVVRRSFR